MAEKLCTIIGMGSGISMSVAQKFAKDDYALALVSRNSSKLGRFVKAFSDLGTDAHGFVADAADFASLKSAFASIHDTIGKTDVLVYNAAAVLQGKSSEIDPEAFINHLRVNVGAALFCAQQVIPHMRETKQGTILFTGGGFGINPNPDYASLAAGKAALRNLTKSLHDELKEDNIHVATVTVAGFVKEGTYMSPNRIAEKYWELHTQPKDQWDWEHVYSE